MIETLRNRHILIVEDEYYLAIEAERELRDAGATVVGPVPSVKAALDLIAGTARIDAAVLDMNLNGDSIEPVADALSDRKIPFIFATGHGRDNVPSGYDAIPRLEKPVPPRQMQDAVKRLLAQGGL